MIGVIRLEALICILDGVDAWLVLRDVHWLLHTLLCLVSVHLPSKGLVTVLSSSSA